MNLIDFTLETKWIKSTPATITIDNYINGGLGVRIIDATTHEPLTTASVWVRNVSVELAWGQFVCKDYSENQGLEDCLIREGLCFKTDHPPVITGYETCNVLQFNPALVALIQADMKDAA